MPFSLEAFTKSRPFLYHFTDRENLHSIREDLLLRSAAKLATADDHDALTERRKKPRRISTANKSIWLQTQEPLHAGNIEFEDGWQMEHLLNRLNSLVFFWPGKREGSSDYGVRHKLGNHWPTQVIALRVGTESLLAQLGQAKPLFCPYNSGAPRCSNGKKSPRGPNTFLPNNHFRGTLSDVIEVAVEGEVPLPGSAQFRFADEDSWQTL